MSESHSSSSPITTETKRGLLALMVSHCAGMVDLVALPIWVGTLMSRFHFDPQQAGGLVTLFLVGTATASLGWASRIARYDAKRVVVTAFGIASLALVWASKEASFPMLAVLHFIGGLAGGSALTFTHGTIGRAVNPHRTFAFANLAIGIFGILLLGGSPGLIQQFGGPALFWILGSVMAAGCIASFLFFPRVPAAGQARASAAQSKPLGRPVWYTIAAVSIMCTAQAAPASFMERIGMARGFGHEAVTTALIVFGFVTLIPGPLAGMLEKRLSATTVVCTVPILQAVVALIISNAQSYPVYLLGVGLMPLAIVFTHTFAFGLLARLDPSGRAVAGTPAMIMVGAAIGPFLSGTIVKFFGFEAIGYVTVALVLCELVLYNMARVEINKQRRKQPVALVPGAQAELAGSR